MNDARDLASRVQRADAQDLRVAIQAARGALDDTRPASRDLAAAA